MPDRSAASPTRGSPGRGAPWQRLCGAVGLELSPDHNAICLGEHLDDVGEARRVQIPQLSLQQGEILPVDQRLDELLVLALLLVGQGLDDALLFEELSYQAQALL
ncbi:hypothetical protein WME76_14405 [Sorangium sp. So ce119]|uniref:hypothetical protein n=1 Tax=Sorangium sp. So ce119 TaxID=3133279 RepID=UPI003F61D975